MAYLQESIQIAKKTVIYPSLEFSKPSCFETIDKDRFCFRSIRGQHILSLEIFSAYLARIQKSLIFKQFAIQPCFSRLSLYLRYYKVIFCDLQHKNHLIFQPILLPATAFFFFIAYWC